jgi:hypothetical protein
MLPPNDWDCIIRLLRSSSSNSFARFSAFSNFSFCALSNSCTSSNFSSTFTGSGFRPPPIPVPSRAVRPLFWCGALSRRFSSSSVPSRSLPCPVPLPCPAPAVWPLLDLVAACVLMRSLRSSVVGVFDTVVPIRMFPTDMHVPTQESSCSPSVADLRKACEHAKLAWSGSNLGYHATVYYEGIQPKPPNVQFSAEWGLLDRLEWNNQIWDGG